MKKFYLLFALLLGALTANAVTITKDTKLYLSPGVWNVDGARFAAYFYTNGGGNEWQSCKLVSGETDIYEVSPSKSYANVIFCRMNGSTTANNWDNKWNQTNDLTWGGTKTLYTISGWGGDKSPGAWSVYSKYPETLYVHGTLLDANWDAEKGYELEKQAEGVFAGTITVVGTNGKGEFAFNENNGSWDTINGGRRYGAASGSSTVTSGSEVSIVKDTTQNPTNFTVTIPAGETSVTVPVLVDLNAMTLTINGEVTGIDEVGVDAGEAVYYNLQGVKVANPENGIFIKKQAGKTTKVIL